MIDTVILRLHNLEKYSQEIKILERNDRSGYTVEIGKVDLDEVDKIKAAGNKKPKQIIEILKQNRTGDFLVKTQRGKMKHSSDHYEFTYVVNWSENYLEINFSIPKYIYGMNVLMYVEHSRDVHYKFYDNSILDNNIKKAPGLFMGFIKQFITSEFIGKIDLNDVEINRIDVCFNQVFKSRADALYYLEYQKKIKKKHSREEGGLPINYGTSLMHATKRYSVKVYHKGTEYKKNDLKQHVKFNKEKKIQYFKTEKIAELADRILRYEVTIRKAELNYLFKHNIFRKDCKNFKMLYRNYVRVAATMQRNDRISKKIGTLEKDEKEIYREFHPYEKIDDNDRINYKYVSNLMESSPKFMLQTDYMSDLYNSETIVITNPGYTIKNDTARFGKELLSLCFKKLTDFINEFQLEELPTEEIVSIKIDRFNKSNRQKLPKAEMLRFYDSLVKSGSFKGAIRLSRHKKATLYRYVNRFKKIGITEHNIKPEENFEFPKASLDLKEYHSFLSDNSRFFKFKHVFYDL